MANVSIKGGESLEELLKNAGDELQAVAIQATKKAAHDAGLKTKNQLKKAPVGGKRYKKGWKMRTNETGIVIHNDTQAGLTWLLENGHDIVRNGRKVGHFDGIPHIKPAEEYGAALFEEGIIDELGRRLGS